MTAPQPGSAVQVGDVIAIGTRDSDCPVGIVTAVDLNAIDRFHQQVMVKFNRARQNDEQPYWEGQCDALDWVLQRLDDIKAQAR